ncbi:MAG: hypothetical protein ACI9O6_002433 [Glaciecola sp.]|jgi:hypothetical protein
MQKFKTNAAVFAYLRKNGVPIQLFSAMTGITETKDGHVIDDDERTLLIHTFDIIAGVMHWFDCDYQCWIWYLSKPLTSFNNQTAVDIVRDHGERGVEALDNFITSKNLGRFE